MAREIKVFIALLQACVNVADEGQDMRDVPMKVGSVATLLYEQLEIGMLGSTHSKCTPMDPFEQFKWGLIARRFCVA